MDDYFDVMGRQESQNVFDFRRLRSKQSLRYLALKRKHRRRSVDSSRPQRTLSHKSGYIAGLKVRAWLDALERQARWRDTEVGDSKIVIRLRNSS
ncbi:hypothetical protein BC938DRAFT_482052, partial [Jimgerdemannia flammicorona]